VVQARRFSKIIERNTIPGSFIPIVRVPGEETVINGEMDRHGHVRSIKDPQRMYNWQSSTMVEILAAQAVSPWIGPKEAFEGLEGEWNNANLVPKPYLVYNHRDEQGQEMPAPQKQIPGQMGPAVVQAMTIAQQEMMMATGQYQAQFGENENAKSGSRYRLGSDREIMRLITTLTTSRRLSDSPDASWSSGFRRFTIRPALSRLWLRMATRVRSMLNQARRSRRCR
jgi:hypothetical protein